MAQRLVKVTAEQAYKMLEGDEDLEFFKLEVCTVIEEYKSGYMVVSGEDNEDFMRPKDHLYMFVETE